MNPNFRHPMSFFRALANRGRADLAATNAAIDGRFRLAVFFFRRHWPELTARQAWTMAWRDFRANH
jgi:hypothetical protein